MHKIIPLALVSLVQIPVTAAASTAVGNPNSSVGVVDGPNVYVVSVVAYRCTSGSQTLPVAAVIAKGGAEDLEFDEDEFCSIDVLVKWAPNTPTVAVGVDGFDVFKSVSGGPTLAIEIDANTQTAELN